MVGSIWLEGIVSQKSQTDERNAMESATSIATEAVISIKTVQSLGKHHKAYYFRPNFNGSRMLNLALIYLTYVLLLLYNITA